MGSRLTFDSHGVDRDPNRAYRSKIVRYDLDDERLPVADVLHCWDPGFYSYTLAASVSRTWHVPLLSWLTFVPSTVGSAASSLTSSPLGFVRWETSYGISSCIVVRMAL